MRMGRSQAAISRGCTTTMRVMMDATQRAPQWV
ncbi:hypothetical protein U703_00515 [Rhodobacter capsulatus YW1]|nr:hypothetical protein U703_00515 [Rhodobacter capsulatus YW1]